MTCNWLDNEWIYDFINYWVNYPLTQQINYRLAYQLCSHNVHIMLTRNQSRTHLTKLTSNTTLTASSNMGRTSRFPSCSISRAWQIQYLANLWDTAGNRERTAFTCSGGQPCGCKANKPLILQPHKDKIYNIGWSINSCPCIHPAYKILPPHNLQWDLIGIAHDYKCWEIKKENVFTE